jgi:hypothetical protein
MTTGMRNVELIKWCSYYGITCMYNILMRFPGETEEDYRMQAELVPKILHLQPPWGIVKARADRGSPMFTEPGSQSISSLKPAACYDHIFPKQFNLERVSYYFDHEMGNVVDEEHYDDLLERVALWQESWTDRGHPTMVYSKGLSIIVIEDRRGRRPKTHTYRDGPAELYEYCADARTPREIAAKIGSAPWVEQALEDFSSKDLMLFLDGRYLSLALPQNPNFEFPAPPSREAVAPPAIISTAGLTSISLASGAPKASAGEVGD